MSLTHSQTRIDSNNGHSSPALGRVYWSSTKSIWITLTMVGALLGGYATFRWDALLLCVLTSVVTLCAGYSVGIHRRLIHNSFDCPQWLEGALVYLGVLVGTAGPFSAIEKHDLQDWAFTHSKCHSYFSHRQNPLKDWFWTLHCDIQLTYPPIVCYEPRIAHNGFYQWLEQTYIVQQLPLAVAFYHFGGWSWVFWGIYVRISACATGQWLVQYLVHNWGDRPRKLKNITVQTGNLPFLGLLTGGEGWQNNHQAFPISARFSLGNKQYDPGWWLIRALQSIGLAWNVKLTKIRRQRKVRPVPMDAIDSTHQPAQMQPVRQKVGVK
ncbi:MAG: acyl-CoA desaturase [Cyanobacteria bacterium J06623_4]